MSTTPEQSQQPINDPFAAERQPKAFGHQPMEVQQATIEANQAMAADANLDKVNQLIVADKELRRDLDTQLQKLKGLKASREHSLAITKLQECIMWLGMSLKALNDTRPYPSSYDPTNIVHEPHP